jgi:eukaryotic-like serine/threonine-protein kinase
MPLNAGARLGPYEILSAIGAGGMGEVYRAKDTRLDRIVAVKVLPATVATNPDRRARFEREARAVGALNHSGICSLYDIGREQSIDFLVMEYLEGESLAHRLARGPLPIDEVLRLGIEFGDALHQAHRQGVIHRDLKPANIMLVGSRSRPSAKLLDFGLAKMPGGGSRASSLEAATETMDLTAEGTILGTFPYMSPGQLEGKDADQRSDLFAIGAVLYEMVTGRRAFQGASQASVIAAVMHKQPEPLSVRRGDAPPALERVIRRCLEKDPEDRWQSARDLALELKDARGVPAEVPSPVKVGKLPWIAAVSSRV